MVTPLTSPFTEESNPFADATKYVASRGAQVTTCLWNHHLNVVGCGLELAGTLIKDAVYYFGPDVIFRTTSEFTNLVGGGITWITEPYFGDVLTKNAQNVDKFFTEIMAPNAKQFLVPTGFEFQASQTIGSLALLSLASYKTSKNAKSAINKLYLALTGNTNVTTVHTLSLPQWNMAGNPVIPRTTRTNYTYLKLGADILLESIFTVAWGTLGLLTTQGLINALGEPAGNTPEKGQEIAAVLASTAALPPVLYSAYQFIKAKAPVTAGGPSTDLANRTVVYFKDPMPSISTVVHIPNDDDGQYHGFDSNTGKYV